MRRIKRLLTKLIIFKKHGIWFTNVEYEVYQFIANKRGKTNEL